MGTLTMGNDGHVTDVGGLVHERPDLIWNWEPTRSASMLSSIAIIKDQPIVKLLPTSTKSLGRSQHCNPWGLATKSWRTYTMVTSYTRVIQRVDFGSTVVYEDECELRGNGRETKGG